METTMINGSNLICISSRSSKSRGLTGRFFDMVVNNLESVKIRLTDSQYTLGRVLDFDAKTEQFVNDAEANQLLTRPYRKPFVVPEQV